MIGKEVNCLWIDEYNEYPSRLVIDDYQYEVVVNNIITEAGSSKNMTFPLLLQVPERYGMIAGLEPVVNSPLVYELFKF